MFSGERYVSHGLGLDFKQGQTIGMLEQTTRFGAFCV